MTAKEMFEKLGYGFKKIFYEDDSNYVYEYSCGGKRFTFQDIDEKGIVTDSVNYISSDELQAIIQQAKELGWIEPEQKQETNFEHYYNDLLKIGWNSNFGVTNRKIKHCNNVDCGKCYIGTLTNEVDCGTNAIKWLASPYKKPTYKLNKFEYDLLNAHKDSGMNKCISNYRPLLELHEKGYFKDIDTSIPIQEILSSCEVVKDENS